MRTAVVGDGVVAIGSNRQASIEHGSPCLAELLARRRRWMARPQAEPGSLRGVRLTTGLSIRELSRRTGIPPELISRVERGRTKSWQRYVERLTGAISAR